MWYELFVITAAGMGFLGFLVFLLVTRVPTPDDLVAIGTAIVDAKIKEFGLNTSAGGRPPEGLVERILSIPGVQEYIGNMVKNMGSGGGMGGLLGP